MVYVLCFAAVLCDVLCCAVVVFRLDLGDVMYPINMIVDEGGRLLLWGWLQEGHGRLPGFHSCSGWV